MRMEPPEAKIFGSAPVADQPILFRRRWNLIGGAPVSGNMVLDSVRPTLRRLVLLLPLLLVARVSLAGAQAPGGCAGDSTYAALDFWLGSWRVYEGEMLVGTNRISKILQGCAVVEEWRDAEGGHGQSLFYVEPNLRQWKQVWVTEAALRVGGVKEKHLIASLPNGGVRFQGELRQPNGRTLLDRTTLVPLPNGEVRQLIEVSSDGGTSWRPTFDARYRRARARTPR
jgi:hypothetical protein